MNEDIYILIEITGDYIYPNEVILSYSEEKEVLERILQIIDSDDNPDIKYRIQQVPYCNLKKD